MMFQTFEIKVALLGYVSVGKTTVINALFRNKYSEVAMRRTTKAINHFRIVTADGKEEKKADQPNDEWSTVNEVKVQQAKEIYKEIEVSNKRLSEASTIEEKCFNIELDRPLCETRPDTSLVLVDIPGINEADTDSIYLEYVNENWSNFDCVVVVMDARIGVNTEEQVDLLRLVKNNQAKKEIPVIILFNKVDNPDDGEMQVQIEEGRERVSQIFNVGCREEALNQMLGGSDNTSNTACNPYPVFIATSAIHAFFYRTGSMLTYDEFKDKFDQNLIDMIGCEEVGRYKWKKLTEEEKYQAVFDAVQDNSEYAERLEATNFDKFLKALSLSVGGNDVQRALLQNQVELGIRSLSPKTASVEVLRVIYEKCRVLEKDMAAMKKAFWAMYESCVDSAISAFENERKVKRLAEPMRLLCMYKTAIESLGWEHELQTIKGASRKLLRSQIGIIINKQDLTRCDDFLKHGQQQESCMACFASKKNPPTVVSWDALSLHDWLLIFESVLLMSCNQAFCEQFGRETIALSTLRHKFATFCAKNCRCCLCQPSGADMSCSNCGQYMEQPEVCPVPWNMKFSAGSLHFHPISMGFVKIPASLSDEKHFGHVAWKCCKLLESIDRGVPLDF